MSRAFSPLAVWAQVPVASRTVRSIKSIQYASVSYSVNPGDADGYIDFTISAVVVANTVVIPNGGYTNGSSAGVPTEVMSSTWSLTSTTNVRCRFFPGALTGSGTGSGAHVLLADIVEFY